MDALAADTTTLRLATAGSVDDGKSTLIGRLLYDSKAILADQVEDLHRRDGELDLSRLTDGLRAEREQGITIDVAYRYFATARRRFILADTPGHVQYTRNMVTGASTADLAIVLVDARNGVVEQTRRHAFLSGLLGIRHLVLAVNKMDLVGFDEETFDRIVCDFSAVVASLESVERVVPIPLSALEGDNVVDRSARTAWYGGPALLEHLEGVDVRDAAEEEPLRLPVQWVVREPGGDYRGYAGQVARGSVRPGDEVVVLPSGARSRVAAIDVLGGELDEAFAPMSVTVRLADDVDVSRGDVLCRAAEAPAPAREVDADVCWMAERPLTAGTRVLVKHTTTTTLGRVDALLDRVDVETLERTAAPDRLELNDIGRVRLRLQRPLVGDPYAESRATGALILVDEATNDTIAAGMLRACSAVPASSPS